ncbi:MAG: exodeoxyribonuclease III [Propionibacteriaceae bacterium]|nr:exodeoxyribonuclease III [Propionibacteriaceae bacterium]
MRIATLNVNGIRAAARRGLGTWLEERQCDIVALQEVRCPAGLIPQNTLAGYHLSYHEGALPGRNGVAVLSRQAPLATRHGFGYRHDAEGRYLEVDYPGLRVGSLYLPKGGHPDGDAAEVDRYRRKLLFLRSFRAHLTRSRLQARAAGLEFIVLGDFNIAHTPADLKNWRSNQRSPGFLPQEREWFDTILGPRSLVDVVRRLHPHAEGPYSWWSWRGQSFTQDVGWRIDYHLASPGLAGRARRGGTDRAIDYESRLSDHAPVVVDYD